MLMLSAAINLIMMSVVTLSAASSQVTLPTGGMLRLILSLLKTHRDAKSHFFVARANTSFLYFHFPP
jgi:hypothetical protein